MDTIYDRFPPGRLDALLGDAFRRAREITWNVAKGSASWFGELCGLTSKAVLNKSETRFVASSGEGMSYIPDPAKPYNPEPVKGFGMLISGDFLSMGISHDGGNHELGQLTPSGPARVAQAERGNGIMGVC